MTASRISDYGSKQRSQGAVGQTLTGTQEGHLEVPLLPLVGSVILPMSVHPLALQGEQAAQLVGAAQRADGLVALFLQRELAADPPDPSDLHTIGTLARLTNVENTADEGINVVAQGLYRVGLEQVRQWEPYVRAEVRVLDEGLENQSALTPVMEQLSNLYRGLLLTDPIAAEKLIPVLEQTERPEELAYLVASTIPISPSAQQAILETDQVSDKLLHLVTLLAKAHEINAKEQLSAQPEPTSGGSLSAVSASPSPLSNGRSAPAGRQDQAILDRIELQKRLQEASLPPEVGRVSERELAHLQALTPTAPDYTIVRDYLQWLADLPWRSDREPAIDLDHARGILDREHYGLADVKARILEYLAVRKLRHERISASQEERSPNESSIGDSREPVLCLVGPPGIGKTSLGRSIADALDRPFVRLSLGGVSDEAEIRGHRRTYLGAMPGKIIRSLARLGTNHPVIMLDEIDKVGQNGKGDLASALLEVLDAEQQHAFLDHYLDVPFDLSSVFFIATANMLDTIAPALRDRLEVLQLSGYTEDEKVQIALRHIVPVQMEWHALNERDVVWEPEAILIIVRSYTREAGVRQLEREVATVCRRIASLVAQEGESHRQPYAANVEFVSEVLGPPRYLPDRPEVTDQAGIVTGAVWTPVGGDIIHVEASMMPGKKTLTITGQLGEVMRESAQAALSYVRSRAVKLGIDPRFYEHNDIHLHIPSGAVPKDGPSAGVTLVTALVSLLTNTPVPSDIAMSGEITLRGRVLPVGGVKEKVLAARRVGMKTVILPSQNRRDLEDIPPEALDEVCIVLAETMDEVLQAALATNGKRDA